jgi:hypothetical protein
MTDALRDAEAAARGLVVSDAQNSPGFSTLLNAYRDAIEKRVRGECDAEAVAAERARIEEGVVSMREIVRASDVLAVIRRVQEVE